MQSLLNLYASYNVWANKEITKTLLTLDDSKTRQKLVSSFTSAHATLVHMYNAETIWFNRVCGTGFALVDVDETVQATKAIAEQLMNRSAEWEKFVQSLDKDQLSERVTYKTMTGEEFTQPLVEILMHVFNHATYHRGQLITMMRNLGATKMPKTDLIFFCRNPSGQ